MDMRVKCSCHGVFSGQQSKQRFAGHNSKTSLPKTVFFLCTLEDEFFFLQSY